MLLMTCSGVKDLLDERGILQKCADCTLLIGKRVYSSDEVNQIKKCARSRQRANILFDGWPIGADPVILVHPANLLEFTRKYRQFIGSETKMFIVSDDASLAHQLMLIHEMLKECA